MKNTSEFSGSVNLGSFQTDGFVACLRAWPLVSLAQEELENDASLGDLVDQV